MITWREHGLTDYIVIGPQNPQNSPQLLSTRQLIAVAERAPRPGFAYKAATGTRRWVKNYGNNQATSVAVNPTGRAVYVTGAVTISKRSAVDYATVAYNAATGAKLWARRYAGPGKFSAASSVAVSPNGKMVFVTGRSENAAATHNDYATVAYRAATGAKLWVKRYAGNSIALDAGATSVAVSPTGKTVFVTGGSKTNYATVAYRAATGAKLWAKRCIPYSSINGAGSFATSVAVSPSGKTVFVTGKSFVLHSGDDYATVAYNAYTGARRWSRRYGPASSASLANAVTVSPTGSTVYVTGTSIGTSSYYDYATVAYNAATGTRRWAKRYKGPGVSDDNATSIAVSPTSGTVFVTGYSGTSYATIAYRG